MQTQSLSLRRYARLAVLAAAFVPAAGVQDKITAADPTENLDD